VRFPIVSNAIPVRALPEQVKRFAGGPTVAVLFPSSTNVYREGCDACCCCGDDEAVRGSHKGRRLTVLSKKTKHHGGDHAVRVVPIQGALHEILREAFEQAPEGATLVAPKATGGGLNLRTTFTKIVARAGCKPWPRLFQNLRASCEMDWVEKHPAHERAAWLGHSPAIAAAHYLQARNHHFETVVNAGRKSDAAGSRKAESKQLACPELSLFCPREQR